MMATTNSELNVLILGETGVGKSTFINGFANYLMFGTLDEAMSHGVLESLIPSSFVMTDDDYNVVRVTTGSSTNENHGAGQSATQSSMVYTFTVRQSLVRLIDTPGIGDVRGPEQDKTNLENIIRTLSNYDVLHGIIILLKPNNSRLNLMFRFCINELLTHLHKSAVHNIVFGFTNTRGTFYKPGDTLPALCELLAANPGSRIDLSKETMYCFDSESFRFLAALKNGVQFSADTKRAFAESWDYSVKETDRLIDHIANLIPHSIKHTVSLNVARNHIVQLTKPMADIMRNVNSNIKLCNDKIAELERTRKHGKELQKSLFVNKTYLEPRVLTQPRTVCTNSACTEIRDFEGNKKIKYINICHDNCQLQNIEVDTLNAAGLIDCWSMNGKTVCRHESCRHSYQEHVHVLYELEEVIKQVKDLNRQNEVDMNMSDTQKKQEFIYELNELKDEYQYEHEIIEDAAAKFGCFLKHNAITPYNNATIEYLNHLIKEEKGKVQAGGDELVLEALERAKDSINEQINAIDRTINSGYHVDVIDPENVTKLAKDLYKLKHFGANLRVLKDFNSKFVKSTYKEILFKPQQPKKVVVPPPPPPSPSPPARKSWFRWVPW